MAARSAEGYYGEDLISARVRIPRRLYIEAVTVCVDYSDFLAHSLLFNKQAFDRLIVATTPTDEATRRLCEYHDIEYVISTDFYQHEGWTPPTWGQGRIYRPPFAKAKGINAALRALSQADWVVHLDADIVLPPRARDMFELAQLDGDCIYGIDRLMSKSYDDWVRHLVYPELHHDANIFVRANSFPLGVRIAPHRDPNGGWLPIGFFQMWHPGKSGIHDYPQKHHSAGRTDMQHGMRWPRERRAIIPELTAIHLESEEVRMGANWEGRRTRFFGPAGMERHTVQIARKEWL